MFRTRRNIFFRVFGVFMVIAGAYFTKNTATFMIGAEPVSASVIAARTKQSDDKDKYLYTVQFTDQSGTDIVAETDSGISQRFLPNDQISVYYNPDSPSEVKFNSVVHIWWQGVSFILIGLAIIYIVWGFPSFRRKH